MSPRQTEGPALLEVISRLQTRGAKHQGNDWTCPGPAHDDSKPSLTVHQGDRGVLLDCKAGCDTKDIAAALGLRLDQLFDDAWEPRSAPSRGNRKPKRQKAAPWMQPREAEAMYPYIDEDGHTLFVVMRYPDKTFAQARPVGKLWEWSLNGTRRVLFDLPRVLSAVREEREIWITEGEKEPSRSGERPLWTPTACPSNPIRSQPRTRWAPNAGATSTRRRCAARTS